MSGPGELTVTRLMTIMRTCAGEGAVQSDDLQDVEFGDLGYDSLAVLETAAHVQREYGVRLVDDEVFEAKTPRDFLNLVNSAIAR